MDAALKRTAVKGGTLRVIQKDNENKQRSRKQRKKRSLVRFSLEKKMEIRNGNRLRIL